MIETVELRHATPDDLPFIMSSWLKSQREAPFALWMTDADYYRYAHGFITRMLLWCDVQMAVSTADPTHIFGYVVYEHGEAIHYLYVKNAFRRLGFATLLAGVACTKTITCAPRFPLVGWTLDPYAALETVYGRRSKIPLELEQTG